MSRKTVAVIVFHSPFHTFLLSAVLHLGVFYVYDS